MVSESHHCKFVFVKIGKHPNFDRANITDFIILSLNFQTEIYQILVSFDIEINASVELLPKLILFLAHFFKKVLA